MAKAALPTWYFALVVVRRGHRFLMTQEKKYGSTWSIPGGRVQIGETLADAAIRETFEETGVPIQLDGILRVEHTPVEHAPGSKMEGPGSTGTGIDGVRVRVIFTGSPRDDTEPKKQADDESLGAAYLTLDEIRRLPLRGSEVGALLDSVANGRQVFPLDLLGHELSV